LVRLSDAVGQGGGLVDESPGIVRFGQQQFDFRPFRVVELIEGESGQPCLVDFPRVVIFGIGVHCEASFSTKSNVPCVIQAK